MLVWHMFISECLQNSRINGSFVNFQTLKINYLELFKRFTICVYGGVFFLKGQSKCYLVSFIKLIQIYQDKYPNIYKCKLNHSRAYMIFAKCDFSSMHESLASFHDFNIINHCCSYVKLHSFGFHVGVRVTSNEKNTLPAFHFECMCM